MTLRFFNCFARRLALLCAGGAAACAFAAETGNWQSLLANNPFSAVPSAPVGPPAGGIEFRGVVQEDGVYLVNLYDPSTRTSQWLPVKGSASGLTVNGYDDQAGKLSITQGGKQIELTMKQSTVALVSAPVVAQPGGPMIQQGMQGRPLPGGNGGPQFNRTLPPETQAMIEEIRRRRAQRQQAVQQGPNLAPAPQASPANAESRERRVNSTRSNNP